MIKNDGPFFSMDDIRAEIDSWGNVCKQCGATFYPETASKPGSQYCDGC